MRRIELKEQDQIAEPDDCDRIVRALASEDIECSPFAAQVLWCRHSENFCASWLILYDDDAQIVKAILGVIYKGELVDTK